MLGLVRPAGVEVLQNFDYEFDPSENEKNNLN